MTNSDRTSVPYHDGLVTVIWQDGAWRCELWKVLGRHILRLFDAESLEFEHLVSADTITASSYVMGRWVRRYLIAEERLCRPHTVPEDRNSAVFTLCQWCLSRGAVLTLKRPDTTWYFCPDCNHHWHARAPHEPIRRQA